MQNKSVATMAPGSKQCELIEKAIAAACHHPLFKKRITNRWIADESLVKAIDKAHLIDKNVLALTTAKLNKALTNHPKLKMTMDRFDGVNDSGLCRVNCSGRHFYHLTDSKNTKIAHPPVTTESSWVSKIDMAQDTMFRERRGESSTNVSPSASVVASSTTMSSASTVGRNESDNSTRIVDATPSDGRSNEEDSVSIQPPQPKRLRLVSPNATTNATNVKANVIAKQSFWESPEAIKLFNPTEQDLTVHETMERRVKFLAAANQQTDGWRHVVDGRDPDNLCSPTDIKNLQQRCMLLCQAHTHAKDQLGRGQDKWTWRRCCQEACQLLNPIGISLASNCETIQRHNMSFKGTEVFPHPNQHAILGKKPEPQMFQVYPELRNKVEQWCTRNVATLSIEGLCDQVHTHVIPGTHQLFIEDLPIDAPVECWTLDHFYNCFNLRNLSFTTTWRWMRFLGFAYDRCKKSFYVDGHERSDVVNDRKSFCQMHLKEHEPRCLRWVHINKSTMSEENADKLKDRPAFEYQKHGVPMLEFHVDDVEDIDDLTTNSQLSMSVRAPPQSKKLMTIGQDECVFSQCLFGQKQWVTPTGERPLMPKTEGEIYMLSAMQSRDFGFGRALTPM